jgi:hypothetical protein
VACRHRRANSGYLPGIFSENPRPKATTALTRWESEPRLGAEMYATWLNAHLKIPEENDRPEITATLRLNSRIRKA